MNQEKIGKFIAECRKEKKITQEELAEKLNVSNKSISRWETGKNMPDYSILKELCTILEVDVNELLEGEKIKKKDIESHSIENLDLILKEYYKMKKERDILKAIIFVILGIILNILVILSVVFILSLGFNDKYDITTDVSKYQEVIGPNAKKEYKSKWSMNEEIMPKSIDNLNVLDFKMVYYNPWDAQYLSYLVVDYDNESYNKEVERLTNYGIEDYIGLYSVTGFSNYTLLAMESDDYYGFIYAITDGKSKIIYVELIYCNYFFDIKYNEQIPLEYLPDNYDATIDNEYSKEMTKRGF